MFFRNFTNAASQWLTRQGAGLGLTIVRGIVEHYDGRIRIDSVESKGTTVEVFIGNAIR